MLFSLLLNLFLMLNIPQLGLIVISVPWFVLILENLFIIVNFPWHLFIHNNIWTQLALAVDLRVESEVELVFGLVAHQFWDESVILAFLILFYRQDQHVISMF